MRAEFKPLFLTNQRTVRFHCIQHILFVFFSLLASCLKSALGEGSPQTSVSFIFYNKMQDLEESSIPHHPSDETIARRKLLSQPQMKDYLSRYNSSCWWLAEVVKDCFANPTGEIHTEEALHYVDCTDINCSLNLRSQILGANFVYYPELFNNISSQWLMTVLDTLGKTKTTLPTPMKEDLTR